MTHNSLEHNILMVTNQINEACRSFQREEGSVQLLAVSKTRSSDEIRQAHQLGLHRFGENYLQEAVEKIEDLADLGLEWHFIGPIQSNKTRTIAEHFAWVHSVDRLKIARRLSKQRSSDAEPLNICVQVNISGEDSKSGVAEDAVAGLVTEINQLPNLRLRGLMAIPEAEDDPELQRATFAKVHSLWQELQRQYPAFDTLSMGMSADLSAAIAEGSTVVRIGSAIFGPRSYDD